MAEPTFIGESVKKIRSSLLLKVLAAVSAADYAAYVGFTLIGWIDWQKTMLLFFFSAVAWFFTVFWLPFWSGAGRKYGIERSGRLSEFVDGFSMLALILVQGLYTAILPLIIVYR